MRLQQKPPEVTMRSVYDRIWQLEVAMFEEAFYHAGSHRTDPLFTGYAAGEEAPRKYSRRPTQCSKCNRVHKLHVDKGSVMCRCGYNVVVSPFDCNNCGAKLGFCEHVVRGYTA